MAYTFDRVDDLVEFSFASLTGYTYGAVTMAAFFKRPAGAEDNSMFGVSDSTLATTRYALYVSSNQANVRHPNRTFFQSTSPFTSSSVFYLLVYTRDAAGTTARWHHHDGTSWTHAASSGSGTYFSYTPTAGDRLRVGLTPSAGLMRGDIVCVGVKKADSTDLAVETLTRTTFQSWRDFSFDWLIGFDSSLVTGGLLQDQSAAGTGDQTAIVGTTPAADPAGWSWGAAAGAVFVPKVTII